MSTEPETDASDDADGSDFDLLLDQIDGRLRRGEAVHLDDYPTARPAVTERLRRILPCIQALLDLAHAPSLDTDDAGLPVGDLGDFHLIREIGRGGMGVVYEAQQRSLDRRVALKVLPGAAGLDPRRLDRFHLEAKAVACLEHPNIVPVHAVGEHDGVTFFAMRYIEGRSLAGLIEALNDGGGIAPIARAGGASHARAVAWIGEQAARALDHAHGRGIVHRDVKPANLLLDRRGNLWVADFGLAQIQGERGLTRTGDLPGTLRYMSPEQALGRAVILDGRADIYGLGATLYELLTLRPAIEGDDRVQLLRSIADDEPPLPRSLNRTVPRDLETIVLRALAKDPAGRYPTALALADDLGRFLDGRPILARRDPPGLRLIRATNRHRVVVGLTAASIAGTTLALLVGLAWSNAKLRDAVGRAGAATTEATRQRDLVADGLRQSHRHLDAFRLRQAADALGNGEDERAQDILTAIDEADVSGFATGYFNRASRRRVVVLSEIARPIVSVAVSPDGRTATLGTLDGPIQRVDLANGRRLETLKGHQHPVLNLDFSPDGHFLATVADAGDDIEVGLWSFPDHRLFARLMELRERACTGVRFDSAGRLWMSHARPELPEGSHYWRFRDAVIEAWDTRSEQSSPPPSLGRWPSAAGLPVSADGHAILTRREGQFVLLDPETQDVLQTFPTQPFDAPLVALSPDARFAAVVEASSTGRASLLIHDFQSDSDLVQSQIPCPLPISIEFSNDSRLLMVCDRGGSSSIHELATGNMRTIVVQSDGSVYDFGSSRFSPDGTLVGSFHSAPSGDLEPARLYESSSLQPRADYPGRLDRVGTLEFLPDSRGLILLSRPHAVHWRFNPPANPPQPTGHADEAWCVAFSPDGRTLASGSDDTDEPKTLKLWDVGSARLLAAWKPHQATVSALAYQPAGRLLATAALHPAANLRLSNATDGTTVADLEGHRGGVRAVAFSPEGSLLASGGNDHLVRLWNVATARCIRVLSGHTDKLRSVAFSPDGRTLASAANDQTLRLWDVATGRELRRWTAGAKLVTVAYSPDGTLLAWGDESGLVHLHDLAANAARDPLHISPTGVMSLAFEPDGRSIAVAVGDGTVHLWDPLVGQEILTLPGPASPAMSLAFAPDGKRLAVVHHNGEVRLIDAADR